MNKTFTTPGSVNPTTEPNAASKDWLIDQVTELAKNKTLFDQEP